MAKRKKQTKLQRKIKAQEQRIQKIIKEIEEAGFDIKYKFPKLGQRPSTAYLKRLKAVKKVTISKASFALTGESYRQWVLNVSKLKREQTKRDKQRDVDYGYVPTQKPVEYEFTPDYEGEEVSEDERLDDLYQHYYNILLNELERAIPSATGFNSLARMIHGRIESEIAAQGFNTIMERIANNWETVWYYLQAAIWYINEDTGEYHTYSESLSYYNSLVDLLMG